jgi:hypothetical protein
MIRLNDLLNLSIVGQILKITKYLNEKLAICDSRELMKRQGT